jgi:hypothetical protein
MKVIATTVSAQRKHNAFQGFKASKEPFVLPEEPLVLGYGAGRYAGSGDAGSMEQINEVSSLFNQVGELYHAETILSDLDYAATKSEGKGAAQERLQKLTEVLAAILPDIEDAAAIEIFPPSIPGTTQARAGVYFRTPYGSVRFRN